MAGLRLNSLSHLALNTVRHWLSHVSCTLVQNDSKSGYSAVLMGSAHDAEQWYAHTVVGAWRASSWTMNAHARQLLASPT